MTQGKPTTPRKCQKKSSKSTQGKAMRRCKICDYETKNSSTMSMHVSMKHSPTKKHKCPKCPKLFAEKTQLIHHFVNNHCPADIPCGFPECPFLFKNTTTQKMHYVRCHLKDKELFAPSSFKGQVTCLTCNIFLKRANMMYHLAQCSTESPFCINVAALQKKKLDEGIVELAGLSDDEDEIIWGQPAKQANKHRDEHKDEDKDKEDEDLDGLLGRILD